MITVNDVPPLLPALPPSGPSSHGQAASTNETGPVSKCLPPSQLWLRRVLGSYQSDSLGASLIYCLIIDLLCQQRLGAWIQAALVPALAF